MISKKYGIHKHVAWLTLVPLLIMAISLETFFLHDRFADLDRDLLTRGQLIARQLAASSEYGVFSNNQTFLNGIATSVLQQPDVRAVIVLNEATKILVASGGMPSALTINPGEIKNAGMDSGKAMAMLKPDQLLGVVNREVAVFDKGDTMLLYQPIISTQIELEEVEAKPTVQQVGAVIIEMSWLQTRKLKSRLLWFTILATAVFLLATLYLVHLASRRITEPISKLGEAIHAIGAGDLEIRVAASSHVTELSDLAHGINAMTAQLQQENVILHQRAEEATRLSAIAFESHESMMITDADGVILRVNQAFTETTGYTAEEAVGQTPRLLKSGRHNADFYHAMWDTVHRTGLWEGEIWDRRKNGEVYPKWLTITAIKGDGVVITHYVGSHIDISERKAAEEVIKQLAFYDPLTGLPNRRLLMDRLHQALASSARSGREGALLFIDLDNFKTLNDTLGHDIGDLLLQQVAQRLESCVREGDTVARLGGDEFVVMLEELSEKDIEAAAQTEAVGEKILATLNQPYQLATHEYHSTPSIGATLFNEHQSGIDDLFKQADIAMYQAKKAGRNAMRFFDPQMQDIIHARAALEGDLRKALESRQFQLYYQIQVDSSHRPLGAEALIRWLHPERGLVSPAQFIPPAEESGLILPIGQWVLETACAQLKTWQQDALTRDLVLAVNVSAKQFHQADFVAQVQAAVQRHTINPMRLKLELTESMLLGNIEDTIATMNTLKEIGVRFSLDDFGTGYSSLQYLKRLPLDQLKIDQSFVRDLAADSSDKAIVRTVIAIAQSLNLDVIAEGVETEEQRQLLLDKGCTHYQGCLFGKPVPIEQFESLLKQV